MKVTSISIPYRWEDIDIENSNLDVFVETDEGFTYSLSFATAKNIEFLLETNKMNYYEPNFPYIIVKKITKEIIEKAVHAYAEESNGYWLNLYHFAGYGGAIDETIFERLKAERLKELERDEELYKFEELNNEYKKFRKKLDELNDEYKKFRKKLDEFD